MDERILIYLFAIAFIGLIILWANTTSALILYGSIAGVILLIVLWGVARVKNIEKTRQKGEQQSKDWESKN